MKKNFLVLKGRSFHGWVEARDLLVGEESQVYDYIGNTMGGDYLPIEVTDAQVKWLESQRIAVLSVEPPETYWGVFYHPPSGLSECVGIFRGNTLPTSTRAENLAREDLARRFGPDSKVVGRIITLNLTAYAQYTFRTLSKDEYNAYLDDDVLVERSV